MSVCLIAIFKNESHILNEWLNHYISQGVEKFFLIDNNSNDNYLDILRPYIDKGIVELSIDRRQSCQSAAYNDHYFIKCKQYDWAIVCDLDEFIYARKGYQTIKAYLEDVNQLMPTVTEVCIPWKMFSSNGFNTMDKPQPSSVIQSFTKRAYYDKQTKCEGVAVIVDNRKYGLRKNIVKTKPLLRLDIHNSETTNKQSISTYDHITKIDLNGNSEGLCEIGEHVLEESFLHLNHYAIQSKEWFMKVKATRGDAHGAYKNHVRNEEYFNRYDINSNDIDDFELRDISLQ